MHYTLCLTLCLKLPPTLWDWSFKVAVPLTLQKTVAAPLLLQKNLLSSAIPFQMSTETSAHFQCLNDTDYTEWSLRMEAILIHRGLWAMIHLEIDKLKADSMEKDMLMITLELKAALKVHTVTKMNKAWAKIILHLEDGQLSHCLWTNDLHAIWLILESIHHTAGFVTSLVLCHKFFTLKKTPSDTM